MNNIIIHYYIMEDNLTNENLIKSNLGFPCGKDENNILINKENSNHESSLIHI